MGDLNGDLRNDHADFVIFKAAFEAAHGTGSFAAIFGVGARTICFFIGRGCQFWMVHRWTVVATQLDRSRFRGLTPASAFAGVSIEEASARDICGVILQLLDELGHDLVASPTKP